MKTISNSRFRYFTSPTRRLALGQRAFTLIELMIVVVIIGVLAALATYSVRNYVNMSKTVEAREIVGKIMSAQEDYYSETQRYFDVTGGTDTSDFYPADTTFDGSTKIQWGADDACTANSATCSANFKTLGVMVNQPVMFRYASTTFAAPATVAATSQIAGADPSNIATTRDGYVVVAKSNLSGSTSIFSIVVGSSWQADLYSENLGE